MAAADAFLDLTSGGIKGETSDPAYPGQIEIDSWSISATNDADITSAKGGASTGRVSVGSLHFTAKQSTATPHLFRQLSTGEHLPTAVLSCRKAGGGTSQYVYFTVSMQEAYLSHHQMSGSGTSDSTADSFSLSYGSVMFEYFTQAKTGTVTSAGKHGWDVRTNKPAAGDAGA
jgi:type VI secretion system secreted protein Hcp